MTGRMEMHRGTDQHGRWRGTAAFATLLALLTVAACAAVNGSCFSLQWGDSNQGQPVPAQTIEETVGAPEAGTPGADDKAVNAWQVTTGSRSVVVAVVDTGVDYTHPDLAANIWTNPGGVGGCPAGTHGYNAYAKTCDPLDQDETYAGHGT